MSSFCLFLAKQMHPNINDIQKIFLAMKLAYVLFEYFSIIFLQRIYHSKRYQFIFNCFIFLKQFNNFSNKLKHFLFFHEGRIVITPCENVICWQCLTNLCSQMLIQLIDVNISLIISGSPANFKPDADSCIQIGLTSQCYN